MSTVTAWDVRIVNATNLSVLAYVSNWDSLQVADIVSETGQGRVNFDYDESWVADFKTANGNYPWEGNYAVQVHRAGTLVHTFLIEESEIEYAGERRRVSMGGRGIAACLEWAVVVPEKYDEAVSDPDGTVDFMNRAFGSTHTVQTDLETQSGQTRPDHGAIGMPESSYGPKYKGYGGGAFVHLFNEADTGNAATTARWLWTNSDGSGTEAWTDVTLSTLPGGGGAGSRNGDPVDWALSLSTNLSEQKDSNNADWSTTATYPAVDVEWLFEIKSGESMLKTLEDCAVKTANAQWRVDPNGKIYIAKVLGTDRTATMMLTVPNAVRSTNSFRRTDLRTSMFISNGYAFEKVSDSTSESTYGRREGFVQYEGSHGESKESAARTALNEVKDPLDEFSFRYIETDSTQAWLDFGLSDMVRLEYEAGVYQDRQVVGIAANITPESFDIEVTIGDLVDNLIAQLKQENDTDQYTWQITQGDIQSSSKPGPPINIVGTAGTEGLSRFVDVTFDQPKGWENEIRAYEAEVYPTAATSKKFRMSREPERGETSQTIKVQGVGTTGGAHVVRARSISKMGYKSEWHTGDNVTIEASDLDDLVDGSTPPAAISNISLEGMLNAIHVTFTDLNDTSDSAMVGNRGFYEIQISNASGGFNETSGNSWTQVVGAQSSGWEEDDAMTFVVPSGKGFICHGLKSESGGRTHYVRARAVNWANTTAAAWTDGGSVDLDLDDPTQLGVIIGLDSILANHIKAGEITGTIIDAGTITASNISVNQTWANAIKMPTVTSPQHAGDLNDGTTGKELTFNIDFNGNMWWGNHTTISNAKDGINAADTNLNAMTSWIDEDGNAQFKGTLSSGTGGAESMFASGALGSERVVIGNGNVNVGAGGSSGGYGYLLGFTGDASENLPGNIIWQTETSGITKFGNGFFVAPRLHNGSADMWKYAGVRVRDPEHHTHSGTAQSGAATTIQFATSASTTSEYYTHHKVTTTGGTGSGQTRNITAYNGSYRIATVDTAWSVTPDSTTTYSVSESKLGEALLVHPADMDYIGIVLGDRPEGSGVAYGEVTAVTTAPGGFRITSHAGTSNTAGGLTLDSGTPAGGTTNRLWNDGGTLKWGSTEVGGGNGGDGDIEGVTTSSTSGLTGGVLSGTADLTIDWTKLSLFTGAAVLTTSDYVAVYDQDDGAMKRTTVNDIVALAPQGDLTGITANEGIAGSNLTGPNPTIYLALSELSSSQAFAADDQVVFTDTSVFGANARGTVQSLVNKGVQALGNSISFTAGNWVYGSSSGGCVLTGGSGQLGLLRGNGGSSSIGYGSNGTNAYAWLSSFTMTNYVGVNTGTWGISYVASSNRLKENVETVNANDALTRIKALRPVEFTWKAGTIGGVNEMTPFDKQRGFIAEEAAAVDHTYGQYGWWGEGENEYNLKIKDPENKEVTDDEFFDLSEAEPVMWEQQAIISDLVSVVQTLEARIAALES